MGKQHEAVMADARAFMRSRIILTAAELDLFTQIDGNPSSAAELAQTNGLDLRCATRLLDCLVVFGLLGKEENGRYHTTENGAFYSSEHSETVLPMVNHLNDLWDTWTHLTETVRTGENPERRPVTGRGDDTLKDFILAMHVVGRDMAGEIAAAYDLGPFRKLLDIGGASGSYTIAFLEKNPAMTAVLFDLDKVIPLAEARLKDEGLLDRVTLAAGDFHEDDLPAGADLALLSAIIHQNSPQENVDLYKKIHKALLPGGVLLIRDHIMDETRTVPPAGAVFAINMLANTKGGDTYTFAEVKDTLEEAGFTDVKWVRNGENMDSLVEARKPA